MVISVVRDGKFYQLPPKKENTALGYEVTVLS